MTRPKTYSVPLFDKRKRVNNNIKIKDCPTVHIARGYESYLPFLSNSGNRPLICISDWQYETATQEHFWEQAYRTLCHELGGEDVVSRAIVLVAGDMASCDNDLRGSKSDDIPNIDWLRKSIPNGSVYMVYGNHDLMSPQHLAMTNQDSGTPCLLPHGSSTTISFGENKRTTMRVDERARDNVVAQELAVQTTTANLPVRLSQEERSALCAKPKFKRLSKQHKWEQLHPDQLYLTKCFKDLQIQSTTTDSLQGKAKSKNSKNKNNNNQQRASSLSPPSLSSCHVDVVRIGSVHGVPAPHTEGVRKIEREEYFQAVQGACNGPRSIDILVTHANPKLPHQSDQVVRGDQDATRLYEYFMQKSCSAKLHVHGHTHSDPAVSIILDEHVGNKVVVNADHRIVAFVPPSYSTCSDD